MRDVMDRALDSNPDYPPGFHRADLERTPSGNRVYWNVESILNPIYERMNWLCLLESHGCLICLNL